MNFKENESQQKLNGCYYTPSWIADYIVKWVLNENTHSILEPSCGEGVFFDSLNKLTNRKNIHITAVDIDNNAMHICQNKLNSFEFPHHLICGDFIKWSLSNLSSKTQIKFDAVLGNPPFIRYQYLNKEVQQNAQLLFEALNLKFTKHTNAWIPFLIASICFLKPRGRIGMIVPSEILHVLYAKEIRRYLLKECSRILFIDPEDIWFEGTLQGAMILLAEKKVDSEENTQGVAIYRTKGNSFSTNDVEMLFNNMEYTSEKFLSNKWTYALLTPDERSVYRHICDNNNFFKFKEIADVDVGIVTGANKFFLVPDNIVEKYNLQPIAYPMFGRSEHCPGIIYDKEQHKQNQQKGLPTNFLYFTDDTDRNRYAEYILLGEKEGLNKRYKCRIRDPWFKVPSVYSCSIGMLKRSNGMPRLIFNELEALTTDTAYRITPKNNIDSVSLVRCFLNSLTALSAELEGRHYGGGVLELVPSEIECLAVPYIEEPFVDINCLNEFVKKHTSEEILIFQDSILMPKLGIKDDEIRIIQNALIRIKNRRQRKNK